MRRINYFKGYLPIYSLAFAEKIMKRGFCPKKIVKNQKEKNLFVFLFEKDFELYNLVRELRKNTKSKKNRPNYVEGTK